MTTYQYSGRITVHGLLMGLVFGIASACILGCAYGYVTVWVPFMYVNFLATIGLGWGTGLAAAKGARMGKLQSHMIYLFIGLIVGLAAEYFNWVWWIFALSRQEHLLFNPVHIVQVARVVLQDGTWGMSEDVPVFGIPLLCVWVVEAGIIIGTAVATCVHGLKSYICCPQCEHWIETPEMTFSFTGPEIIESVVSRLRKLEFSCFDDMQILTETPYPDAFYNLDLFACPSCRHFYCFSFTQVEIQSRKKKAEKKETCLIHRQLLSLDTLQELMACCSSHIDTVEQSTTISCPSCSQKVPVGFAECWNCGGQVLEANPEAVEPV